MLSYYNPVTPEFRLSINIRSEPTMVFSAWAVQGDMEAWGMKKARFYGKRGKELLDADQIALGNKFCWVLHTRPEEIQEGKVAFIKNNQLIGFDLKKSGVVTIACNKVENGITNLSLTHKLIKRSKRNFESLDSWLNTWSFLMINLKSFLEYGISLNENNIPLMGKERLELVNQ